MVRSDKGKRALSFLVTGAVMTALYLIICHCMGRTPSMKPWRCALKVPINLCWLLTAWILGKPFKERSERKIFLALVFYALGDIIAPASYLVGGGAYGIGHLFAIDGYIRSYGMSGKQLLSLAGISAVFIIILISSLGFDWRIPLIAVYIIILATLLVSSSGDKYYFLTVGIFLFSDVIAYVRKMFFNHDWIYDITLSVYYAAIIMYCLSFRRKKTESVK